MKIKPSEANIIPACGLIGILGALLTIASDVILLGRPNSAFWFFKVGTENMAFLSQWRIPAGTFIGVMVLPLQLAGLISVYYGLKPAGKRLSLFTVLTAAHALIMGVAFHTSYAFIGNGWKLYHAASSGKISETIGRFESYWKLMIIIMFAELLFSSACYVLTILTRKTLFPKWMAILNPLCVYIFVFPFIYVMPSPIGGFVAPAYLNLSTMVFFVFSTITISKRLNANWKAIPRYL